MTDKPFGEFARLYREWGLWPRPITPGSKACPIKGWQNSDHQFGQQVLENWLRIYAGFGIGLVMGSPLADGTTLGAVDIDRNDYVRLAEFLLGDPGCGRVGQKGAAYFVRVRGKPKNGALKTPDGVQVADLLFSKKLCVIPPTVHPSTGDPYRWIGRPLHEIEFTDLPLIEA